MAKIENSEVHLNGYILNLQLLWYVPLIIFFVKPGTKWSYS